jgi:hypothetical protein
VQQRKSPVGYPPPPPPLESIHARLPFVHSCTADAVLLVEKLDVLSQSLVVW